jgi:hypothetical protein
VGQAGAARGSACCGRDAAAPDAPERGASGAPLCPPLRRVRVSQGLSRLTDAKGASMLMRTPARERPGFSSSEVGART